MCQWPFYHCPNQSFQIIRFDDGKIHLCRFHIYVLSYMLIHVPVSVARSLTATLHAIEIS